MCHLFVFFVCLSAEIENPRLKTAMNEIVEDLQGGSYYFAKLWPIIPDVFSSFYVNLVRSGEESGSLEKSFSYLADYLDRSYEVVSKPVMRLMYPAFVIVIFIAVMSLMLTMVIPKIAQILIDSGQELPIYTKIVIGISDFLVNYIGILLILISVGGVLFGGL
jgi:type II secretory pathway component PulF